MAELQMFSEKELQQKFDEKNGSWLFNIAKGIDLEPVQARFNPKSIGCCKQFKGKAALLDLDSIKKWLKDLGDEIEDRLEKDALENNRTPKQMVVSYSTQIANGRDISSSRSYNFTADDEICGDLFSSKAFELLMESSEGVKPKEAENNRKLKAPIKFMGISVGKFEDHTDKKTKKIKDYFAAAIHKTIEQKHTEKQNKTGCNKGGKEYIMQKFLQLPEKVENTNCTNYTNIESSLDKQESFFAKMLNRKLDTDARSTGSSNQGNAKPNTPVCEVTGCGEESNDSEVSGSTINNEINKSISLFEADPQEVDRVHNIRQLMNNSKILAPNIEISLDTDDNVTENAQENNTEVIETFNCTECGKSIPIQMVEQHSDYHLALKLRDEERELVRKDRDRKITLNEVKKKQKEHKRSESVSIANYLLKVDDTIPTNICSECGKKVPVEVFQEHLDFHEAQKLNRELNRRPLTIGSSFKRKRKSDSPVKKLKIPNCKSIDSFFR